MRIRNWLVPIMVVCMAGSVVTTARSQARSWTYSGESEFGDKITLVITQRSTGYEVTGTLTLWGPGSNKAIADCPVKGTYFPGPPPPAHFKATALCGPKAQWPVDGVVVPGKNEFKITSPVLGIAHAAGPIVAIPAKPVAQQPPQSVTRKPTTPQPAPCVRSERTRVDTFEMPANGRWSARAIRGATQPVLGVPLSAEQPLAPVLSHIVDSACWDGTYSDGPHVYKINGSGSTVTGTGTWTGGPKQGGTTNFGACTATGDTARCPAAIGEYHDPDKSITWSGQCTLKLSGTTLTTSCTLAQANAAWNVSPYPSSVHAGATFTDANKLVGSH